MKFLFHVYFILFIFFFPFYVAAEIKINEFLIDPQPQQVELVNASTESADISHWYIDDSSGSTYFTIPSNTVLPPLSCNVFTSDFSLNKVSADTIRLFDSTAPPTSSSSRLIDSFSYKSSPGTGISFQRIPDASVSWASGAATIGLWNNTGLSCITTPTPTLPPIPTSTPFTPINISSYSQPEQIIEHIYISEAMVNPQTGEKEWIELYNNNSFEVQLDHWYIDDGEDTGGSPISFSMSFQPYQYKSLDMTASLFNNEADQVRLLNNKKQVVDSFVYGSSERGFTYSRITLSNNYFCITSPTKNIVNESCTPESVTSSSTTLINPPISPTISVPLQSAIYSSLPIPTSLPYQSNNSEPLPFEEEVEQESILGTSTKYYSDQKTPHTPFYFSSVSFAFLTIASVFLRMKTRV